MALPEEQPEPDLASPRMPEVSHILKGDLNEIDWRVAEAGLPVLVFLVLNVIGPAQLAIGASFAASVSVFLRNRDSGVIRALAIMGFLVVTGSAIVGLAADSTKAFAAQNIVSDFLVAVVGVGSIAIGRPLVGAVARESIPALRSLLDVRHRTFIYLTLGFVALNIVTGVIRIFLLDALSTNEYVLASRAVGFPLSAAFFVASYFAVKRAAAAAPRSETAEAAT